MSSTGALQHATVCGRSRRGRGSPALRADFLPTRRSNFEEQELDSVAGSGRRARGAGTGGTPANSFRLAGLFRAAEAGRLEKKRRSRGTPLGSVWHARGAVVRFPQTHEKGIPAEAFGLAGDRIYSGRALRAAGRPGTALPGGTAGKTDCRLTDRRLHGRANVRPGRDGVDLFVDPAFCSRSEHLATP